MRCNKKVYFFFVSHTNGSEMSMGRTIPVRLNDSLRARLDAAAARLGTKRAGLIRFLTHTWLDHVERSGIETLPPKWQAIMDYLDGRSATNRGTGTYRKNRQTENYRLNEGKK
jgi:hypothetical protein